MTFVQSLHYFLTFFFQSHIFPPKRSLASVPPYFSQLVLQTESGYLTGNVKPMSQPTRQSEKDTLKTLHK